jgi:hypothetical protein
MRKESTSRLLDTPHLVVLSLFTLKGHIFLQVDVFLSRDLDSRISAREVAAVQQFLSSDKTVSTYKQEKHVKEMLIIYMSNYLGYDTNNLGDVNNSKGVKYGHGLYILQTAVPATFEAKANMNYFSSSKKRQNIFTNTILCTVCSKTKYCPYQLREN